MKDDMAAIGRLRDEIISTARTGCMDFAGFAAVHRFASVHPRMRPEAHLKGANCVVSIGIRYPLAMYENAGRTKAESYMVYVLDEGVRAGMRAAASAGRGSGQEAAGIC